MSAYSKGRLPLRRSLLAAATALMVGLLTTAAPKVASSAAAFTQPSVTIGTVAGTFYPNSNNSGAFDTSQLASPAFTQSFPVIDFNPPSSAQVNCTNSTGVDENTRPFTDVVPNSDGSCSTLVAAGNGVQAGTGSLYTFEAVFQSTLTVDSPAQVTFNFFSDDGWILGLGQQQGGTAQPTYVSGQLSNAPSTSPVLGYPVVGALNGPSAPTQAQVTVNFPAAGIYPMELDYTECCGGQLALTMGTTAGNPILPTPNVVVAMGDSYMSGEGTYPAVDYYVGTETGQDTCHRSPASYAILLGVLQSNFVACSGATISDLKNGFKTEPSQLNVLAPDVRVVLLTIGGDDADFVTILDSCIDFPLPRYGHPRSLFECLKAIDTALGKMPAISQNLAGLFGLIRQQAPGAQIVLVGYPHLFPPFGSGPGCNWISANRQRLINGAGDALDSMLASTANGYPYVTYVDTRALFLGHEICGGNTRWINDLQTDHLLAHNCPSSYLVDDICSQSFHPNVLGYAAEAQLLKPVLSSLTGG
jgi:hypothetical protein